MPKIIEVTAVYRYKPEPQYYPECESIEEMAELDNSNWQEGSCTLEEVLGADPAKVTVTHKVIVED